MRRHLAEKVDVREVSHLEQLETRSDPQRNPTRRELATAFLGLVPERPGPERAGRHALASARRAPRARVRPREILLARASGCARSSRTRTSASRSRRRASRSPSCATSTPRRSAITVSATNLQRVLLRRRTAGGHRRAPPLRKRRRPAGDDLPFPQHPAGGDGSVRRPSASYNGQLSGRPYPAHLMQPRRSAPAERTEHGSRFLFGIVAAASIPAGDRADAEGPRRGSPRRGLGDSGRRRLRRRSRCSLLAARRGAIVRTLERTGGSGWIRLGRILAVAGICLTLSASIAVGLYELLLRLEH